MKENSEAKVLLNMKRALKFNDFYVKQILSKKDKAHLSQVFKYISISIIDVLQALAKSG